MNTSNGQVRPRRSTAEAGTPHHRPVVAVTGAADGVGRALVARLADSDTAAKVVAIDERRGDVRGVTWRLVDVRAPRLAARLTGVDVIVHLDDDRSVETPARRRRAYNVRGAQTVLTAAAAERVPHVVLVTSSMVYGARPDNPVPMAEGELSRADHDSGLVGDFLEIEELAERARRTHPGLRVTVVRPAALVGPGLDSYATRHFAAPRLLTVRGAQQRWQFCHVDDLVSALEFIVSHRLSGPLAVGCDGWLDSQEALEISGLRKLELPATITFGTAQRLHHMGVTPAPAGELAFMVYPWVVDAAALREAGWRPAHDNAAALRVLLDARSGHHALGRHVGAREATIATATAAGATVAVIGAAVVLRRARRRGRG
ncbi:NAD-dependent epimerase/dehydratase family protein [Allonocardiopsis opalescens]|uniref:Nucleoside-diphosphate-sugar epimerase n=1 Tax=Allonocardiopsis opalescens TaxID=1144618 RepID=A0A2T0QDT1_9ACTN|nr:NAD-dependent epimerase/dehydratase family protein [Allonocardiopsis opalescens]PRY02030.1 nucleoside-diphosphate-sugar epimerase [Allonocardiopsis opalescens]